MYEVKKTKTFKDWQDNLKDETIKHRIDTALIRMEGGNLGNCKSVGDGVSELKLNFGPGYRLYYTIRGQVVIILLCGGTKSTQDKDIAKAKELAKGEKL